MVSAATTSDLLDGFGFHVATSHDSPAFALRNGVPIADVPSLECADPSFEGATCNVMVNTLRCGGRPAGARDRADEW